MSGSRKTRILLTLAFAAVLTSCGRHAPPEAPKAPTNRLAGGYTLPGEKIAQPPGAKVSPNLPAAPPTVGTASEESKGEGVQVERKAQNVLSVLAVLFILAFVIESVIKLFVRPFLGKATEPAKADFWAEPSYYRPRPERLTAEERLRLIEAVGTLCAALLLLWIVPVRLFTKLGYRPTWEWIDTLLTALIVAAGTGAIRELYEFLEGSAKGKQEKPGTLKVNGDIEVHEPHKSIWTSRHGPS